MWSAVQDIFRGIYTILRVLFPNLESIQPVLVEFEPDEGRTEGRTLFGIINLRDPRDFNHTAFIREIVLLTQNPRSQLSTRVRTVDVDSLRVHWSLGHRYLIRTAIPDDFEFRRIFPLMESRGWKDHFVVEGSFTDAARPENVRAAPIVDLNAGSGLNSEEAAVG